MVTNPKNYIWVVYPSIVMRLRRLVALITLSALGIAIQLTPRPPNIEVTSLIVFLVSTIYGTRFGIGLGTLVMSINGFLSPYGFAGLILPFQIVGIATFGIVGGIYGRTKEHGYSTRSCLETAILGGFLTFIYDVITNFGVAVTFTLGGMPMPLAIVSAIISGTPFSMIHIISNIFVFGLIFLPVIRALQILLGGEKKWRKELLPT